MAGVGRHGGIGVASSAVQRAHLDEVVAVVNRFDRDAFMTIEELKVLHGGRVVQREWKMGAEPEELSGAAGERGGRRDACGGRPDRSET